MGNMASRWQKAPAIQFRMLVACVVWYCTPLLWLDNPERWMDVGSSPTNEDASTLRK